MRSGIEERIGRNSAQRRPPVIPDDMRAPRGTTTPRHRPTNPAVGRQNSTDRPTRAGPVTTSDGTASRNPAGATSSGGASGGAAGTSMGAASFFTNIMRVVKPGRGNGLVRIQNCNNSLFSGRFACPTRKAVTLSPVRTLPLPPDACACWWRPCGVTWDTAPKQSGY